MTNYLLADKCFLWELSLVLFGYESLPTVPTLVDLWFVQVDIDPGVSQSTPTTITPGVASLDRHHRLLC